MAPSRQMAKVLKMLAEIIERLERLENPPAKTTSKPAAKKAASK